MSDIRTCDKDGCSNTFDIDDSEGVIISSFNDGVSIMKCYCCELHARESQ